MRILLAHNSPYYPSFGGGDKSNRLLMEALAGRGHQVVVAARLDRFGGEAHERLLADLAARSVAASVEGEAVCFTRNGVDVRVLTLDPQVRTWFAARIQAFDPDVILTSTDDPAHLMLEPALRSPRARVVYLVRATVALPFGPDASLASELHTAVLRQADGVVAVSEFVAGYARKWGGLDAVHVPISLLEQGEIPWAGGFDNPFVTMVNPCAVKGISIFLELARRFPSARFAAAPTWGTSRGDLAALRELPNVVLLEAVDDIHDILRQTRVVVVPSLWAEARSRMILESMARGIPVLASDVGGLAEAMLGMDYLLPVRPVARYQRSVDERMVPAAEIPEQDIDPWQAALGRLLTDGAHYESLSSACRARALEYARGLTCEPFEAYLEKIVQSPPRLSAEKRRLLALRLKRKSSPNIEVFHDGIWVRRVGSMYFPDPDYQPDQPNWQRFAGLAEKYLRDANDYWFYLYKPSRGDTIVDAGAGRGEDVLALSRAVGEAGRVIAIEPHPVSFQVLRKFCEWNRLSNVTALNYACIDRPTQLQIETLPVWESNFVREGAAGAASQAVDGVTLDSLLTGVERIDFLKMNIEGAESSALPGCREMLQRTRYVCIAAHDFRADRGEGEDFRTLAFVRRFLTDAGFTIVTRDTDPRYYVPYHVHGRKP
jgi:FkbM family methyltransferase